MERLDEILDTESAGDPMKDGVKWTCLNPSEIKQRMAVKGTQMSEKLVVRLLKKKGLRRRKFYKNMTLKQVAGRNEQFLRIGRLKKYYLSRGHAVISVDTKKKEQIGMFYREGEVFCSQRVEVLDHDFASFSEGKITPYGIYDVGQKAGYITIGESADTAELSVLCIKNWWEQYGKTTYKSRSILILCDGGGSNGSKNNLFKDRLDQLSKDCGISIRVAHYPPYCSKYNPIEHRLFPTITNAWKGVILRTVEVAKRILIERTMNLKSGLKVFVSHCTQTFEKGIKVSQDNIQKWCLVQDNINEQWNYRFIPK